MSTAREKIIRSQTANKVLDRYISPIYENSSIGCTDIEVRGREIDSLEALIEDVYNQFIIHKATWALPMWCYEYGVEINEGMTYEEVRRLVKERRFLVLPPNEYNIEQYASIVSGTEVRTVQNTAPHTFDVLLIRDPDNPTPYNWSEVYRAVKRIRPAHLTFNLIPTVSKDIGIDVSQYIIKFYNPLTGEKGLRSGTFPRNQTLGQIIRANISVESAGSDYPVKVPETGTRPGINKYAELYFTDIVSSSSTESKAYMSDTDRAPVFNLGIVESGGIGVDTSSSVYDIDIIEAGIRTGGCDNGGILNGISAETETQTFGIVSEYCGLSELGEETE